MTERLGFGVMINKLFGAEASGVPILKEAIKERLPITRCEIIDNELRLEFGEDHAVAIWDAGQSCCEHRWMESDDDLNELVGSILLEGTIESGPDETSSDWGDVKESQFLKLQTTNGFATIKNYNDHNGYYGGFAIAIREA